MINQCSSRCINILKIIAAQCVLIGHACSLYQVTVFKDNSWFPDIQNIAVVVLFVLSGYLTAYSVERRRNTERWVSYLYNRFVRICIPMYGALILISGIDLICIYQKQYAYGEAFTFKTLIGNLLMVQGFPTSLYIDTFGSAKPLWTLTIEWWLYVWYSFIVWDIVPKLKNIWKIKLQEYVVLLLVSIVPVWNMLVGRGNRLTWTWLSGILLFYCISKKIIYIKSQITIYVVIALLLLTGFKYKDAYCFEFKFLTICFLGCILSYCHFKEQKVQCCDRYIKYMASFSYSLYLLHYSILELIKIYDFTPICKLLLGVVLSNIIAYVFYRYVEMNIGRIKETTKLILK